MSKPRTISDLALALQSENEELQKIKKNYEKLLNFICKDEFGMDAKSIHSMIKKQAADERRKAEKKSYENIIETETQDSPSVINYL